MKISFDHCLRPEFTQRIYSTLRDQRMSLNLIGSAAQGKSRLIDDLVNCKLPQDTKIIRINFSEFKKSYQAFENSVKVQVGIPSEEKMAFDKAINVYLENNNIVYALFILDNFDSICENEEIDVLYNRNFQGNLNALKNGGKVSLLCISKKSIKGMIMYVKEEKEVNGQKVTETIAFDSPLDLGLKEISNLSEKEIEADLLRSNEKLKQFLKNEIHSQLKKDLILFIQTYKFSNSLLDYCKDKLPSELNSIEKDWKKWKKNTVSSLESHHKHSVDKRIRNWDTTVKKILDRTARILKTFRTFKKATTIWGKILQWIIGIGVPVIAVFYKKFLHWIELLFQ